MFPVFSIRHTMKNFLFLLLATLLLISTCAKAQRIHNSKPGPSGPVVVSAGELFFGTWQWSSGNDVFRVVLAHNAALNIAGVVSSATTGQHRYVRNGAVVEQYAAGGTKPYSLLGIPRNNNVMTMSFHEFSTNKWGVATLTLVPGNPNQLTWQLVPQEGLLLYTGARPADYFVTPLTLTLTRIP